jgi:two-component system sensor histidine kinase KdpD
VVGAVAVATLAMLAVRARLDLLNVLLLYLLVSFVVALLAGSGAAAFSAALGFLAFNYFFIPPYGTLTVARPDHVLALIAYVGIVVVTGRLVARLRARTEVAEREQRRAALLYELNAALVGDVTLDDILARIVERVVHVYGTDRCRILLPDDEGMLTVRARFPPQVDLDVDRQSLAVASWVLEHGVPAGLGTARTRIRHPSGPRGGTLGGPRRRALDALFLPIATAERTIGALEVVGRPGGGRFRAEDERLLTSFADQAALALERARLTEEAARAVALAQSDELKSALLAAVSHDLRTPLASIKTAATSLLDSTVDWDAPARREFLEAIDEETDRLTSMVGNLLDLSRIEGGALRPEKEWYDVAELVDDVACRLEGRTAAHPLTTTVEPDLPLACFDYVEIAQVLLNLGENAIKHTPPGTPITISADRVPGAIRFAVRDEGPGLPVSVLPHLFEKFYRGDRSGRVAGTGFGLAICKGFVEAHGGRIWVDRGDGPGSTFRFDLPLGREEGGTEPRTPGQEPVG